MRVLFKVNQELKIKREELVLRKSEKKWDSHILSGKNKTGKII